MEKIDKLPSEVKTMLRHELTPKAILDILSKPENISKEAVVLVGSVPGRETREARLFVGDKPIVRFTYCLPPEPGSKPFDIKPSKLELSYFDLIDLLKEFWGSKR